MSFIAIVSVTWIGWQLAASDIPNIRGDEPYFVSGVLQILRGGSLYTSPCDFPYLLTGYTPAAYYVAAWSASLAGYDWRDQPDVVHAARTVSLWLTLFHLFLVFVLMWRFLGSRPHIALIGSAIVYSIRIPWGFLVRPDPLFSVLFISSLMLTLVSLGSRDKTVKSVGLSVLAGVVASLLFLTKQTGVQLPLVVLVFHCLSADWRRIVSYTLGWMATLVLAAFLFSHVFGPDWGSGMFLTIRSGVNVRVALEKVFSPVMVGEGGAALLAAAIPAWLSWIGPRVEVRYRFLTCATVGSLLFSSVTAFSSGAAEHYFSEAIMLVVVCLAAFWGAGGPRDRSESTWNPRFNCVVGAYCALFLPFFLYTYGFPYLKSEDRFERRYAVRAELERRLSRYPEAKFLTVDNTLANFFPDRVVVPQYLYAAVFCRTGALDLAALQAYLDRGQVRWCVIGAEQDLGRQLGFLGLGAAGFRKEDTVDGFSFWVFRD